MKKIMISNTFSVIFGILWPIRKKSEKKNDLTEENLKGKVKSIKETLYEAVDKFGQIEKGNVLYDAFTFPFTIYDEKGNNIEENHYDSDGRLSYKYIYKYDKKGNNIEENHYDSDGRLDSKYIYKYDEKGNKIEENRYDSNGRLSQKTTYKYDEKGNTIEKNDYDSDGRPAENYSYKYEYDKNNNWTQRIEYKNTIPVYITERIIEYYP